MESLKRAKPAESLTRRNIDGEVAARAASKSFKHLARTPHAIDIGSAIKTSFRVPLRLFIRFNSIP